jgi:hypothetical protein
MVLWSLSSDLNEPGWIECGDWNFVLWREQSLLILHSWN